MLPFGVRMKSQQRRRKHCNLRDSFISNSRKWQVAPANIVVYHCAALSVAVIAKLASTVSQKIPDLMRSGYKEYEG